MQEGGLRINGKVRKGSEGKPIISVITVVFNGGALIERTIKSVVSQPYSNIEFIIIDGDSTDGTLDIVKKYTDQIDYWKSEADNGIYDAMNKGIANSTGSGLLFVNAGDCMIGDVFGEVPIVPCFIPIKYVNFLSKMVDGKRRCYKQGIPVSHQGVVFKKINLFYDTTFQVASDYDYYLKHGYKSKLPFTNGTGHIYYDNSGFSKVNYAIRDREIKDIIRRNFGLGWASLFALKARLKNLLKRLIN